MVCSDPALVTGLLPSDDTYINAIQPDTNFGTDTLFQVWANSGGNRRGLLRFDLSSIPTDAIITSATLYIYTSDSSTGVVTSVYRVTSPWSETTATWNSPWSIVGGDYNNLISYASYSPNTANCMVTLNLTSLVSQWVNGTYQNYGMLLLSTGNNHAFRYVSKEETTNLQNRPRLSVTYTTPTKKGTAIFLDWFRKTPKP